MGRHTKVNINKGNRVPLNELLKPTAQENLRRFFEQLRREEETRQVVQSTQARRV